MTRAVARFHDSLSQVLKLSTGAEPGTTPEAEFAARVAVLAPAVSDLFDIDGAARLSVGRGWRDLTDSQRGAFAAALETMIVRTYAARFDRYRGQHFEHRTTHLVGGSWVVRTVLLRPGEDDVQLDYYFRDAGVFNVVAAGVSDVALRRAEYSAVLKSAGIDALIAHVQAASSRLGP